MNIPPRREIVRRMWPKRQPHVAKPKNPGESRTRKIVKARAGGRCERCGANGETVHHRVNRSQGGPWTPSNCVLLCGDGARGCHGWATTAPISAWLDGYHLKPKEDPTKRPIEHAMFGRVLLLDDGTYTRADNLDDNGEPQMSWTQPFCRVCFAKEFPTREPHRLKIPETEKCCRCGETTCDGIYGRVDPATVAFPAEDNDR